MDCEPDPPPRRPPAKLAAASLAVLAVSAGLAISLRPRPERAPPAVYVEACDAGRDRRALAATLEPVPDGRAWRGTFKIDHAPPVSTGPVWATVMRRRHDGRWFEDKVLRHSIDSEPSWFESARAPRLWEMPGIDPEGAIELVLPRLDAGTYAICWDLTSGEQQLVGVAPFTVAGQG